MTNIPADKTAKRTSTASTIANGRIGVLAAARAAPQMPPGDRIAVRS